MHGQPIALLRPPAFAAIPCGDGYDFQAACLHANTPVLDASWQAAFEATHGYAPTIQDMMDPEWSVHFYATYGRAPTDEEGADQYY
jgi:hypothetical protein